MQNSTKSSVLVTSIPFIFLVVSVAEWILQQGGLISYSFVDYYFFSSFAPLVGLGFGLYILRYVKQKRRTFINCVNILNATFLIGWLFLFWYYSVPGHL